MALRFGAPDVGAGESRPAIASLEPRTISYGLKAGGEKGEVSGGKKPSASEVVETARRCRRSIGGCIRLWAFLSGSGVEEAICRVGGVTDTAGGGVAELEASSCEIMDGLLSLSSPDPDIS